MLCFYPVLPAWELGMYLSGNLCVELPKDKSHSIEMIEQHYSVTSNIKLSPLIL